MELDKRIIKNYKIYTCFDTEDAKRYLHTSGYFADHIEDFKDLDYIDMRELTDIQQEFKYPYSASSCNDSFKFFLPCAFVAEEEEKKEKKLRPFKSIEEFYDETGFGIGKIVQIKRLGDYTYEETSIFNGFRINIHEEEETISVIFGSCSHSFEELFRNFRYLKNSEWLPFGIEEEDK